MQAQSGIVMSMEIQETNKMPFGINMARVLVWYQMQVQPGIFLLLGILYQIKMLSETDIPRLFHVLCAFSEWNCHINQNSCTKYKYRPNLRCCVYYMEQYACLVWNCYVYCNYYTKNNC